MIPFNFKSELTGEIKTLYVSKEILVDITGHNLYLIYL